MAGSVGSIRWIFDYYPECIQDIEEIGAAQVGGALLFPDVG